MAEVLSRLFHLTGDAGWRARADAALRAFSGQPDQLSGMPTLLAAADLLEEGASVVIVGGNSAALAEAALSAPDPAVVVLRAADSGSLPSTILRMARPRRRTARSLMCAGGMCAACR